MVHWVSHFCSDADQALITKAVAQAEMKTSGEIVPMVVRSSGRIPGLPWALARYPLIRRLFISRQNEIDAVQQRARAEFESLKIQETKDRTGILIFVSVLERRAVVLADQNINIKVGTEVWNEVLEALTGGLAQGQWVVGFEKAIAMSGEILHKYFPIQHNDKNELKNHLVIKE